MSKEQTRLAETGIVLGAVFGLCLLLTLAGENGALLPSAISALVPAGLGILQLGFRDEAQVRWFRCVLFVPYVVAIGGLVLILAIAKLSGEHPPELLGTIAIGTVLVAGATFLFTPPIWLLRALHLWFSNRQTRRILAAVQGPGLDGGRGPRAALSYRRPTAGSLAPSRVRPGSGS